MYIVKGYNGSTEFGVMDATHSILSGSINRKVNSPSSFKFSVDTTHESYQLLTTTLSTYVEVSFVANEKTSVLFYGRISSVEMDFNGIADIECESILANLCDVYTVNLVTKIKPNEWSNFFDLYNNNSYKKGYQNEVITPTIIIDGGVKEFTVDFKKTLYENLIEAFVKGKALDGTKKYCVYDAGRNVVISSRINGATQSQTVRHDVNLISWTTEKDAVEDFSVLQLYGPRPAAAGGGYIIGNYNGTSLVNTRVVKRYVLDGEWDEASVDEEARRILLNPTVSDVLYDITAFDMGIFGEDFFEPDRPVSVQLPRATVTATIISAKYDLFNPSKDVVTLGTEPQSIAEAVKTSNRKTEEKIDAVDKKTEYPTIIVSDLNAYGKTRMNEMPTYDTSHNYPIALETSRGKVLTDNQNLNNVRKIGVYYSPALDNTRTMTNLPDIVNMYPSGFRLDVLCLTTPYDGDGWKCQRITTTTGVIYERAFSVTSNSFLPWKCVGGYIRTISVSTSGTGVWSLTNAQVGSIFEINAHGSVGMCSYRVLKKSATEFDVYPLFSNTSLTGYVSSSNAFVLKPSVAGNITTEIRQVM